MKDATLQLTVRRILRASALAALAGIGTEASGAQLPVPCLSGSCGAAGPGKFVTSGTANAIQVGNSLTVAQGSAKAILNWASFNVSADGKVVFQQPTATSIALNRIFDANPSTIFGTVNANGQIYLINPNGIVFGPGAQVNVSGLVASTLGISDSTFASGLLSPQLLFNRTPALTSDPQVESANGNPQLDSSGNLVLGSVSVASGAQITANSSGRVLLAAPVVKNAGSIQAPDGQVILAAGQKVYLQGSNSPELRGLVVEVDAGGTAWNQLTGALNAPRGNISLVGLAVNQDGRVSATTTVASNGSVRLEAGETTTSFPASLTDTASQIQSSHGGVVELGPQSSISVLPELNDPTTAVDAQPQAPSTVKILGERVFMHGGSITAPGGQLEVIAAANPGAELQGVLGPGNPDARIRIDSGTTIDLSGSATELPMSANLVTVQLRANELADDPTQRNGALRGQTVVVDARVGTPIANVQSAIAAVPKSIAQRTEAGGSAAFVSEGDVVFAPGATVNVSGGETRYDGGVMQTTQLIGANGKLYDVGTANPLLSYSGVLNPTFTQTFDKWGVSTVVPTPGLSHYEAGYVQGAAAGQITFAAPSMVLNGTLAGHAVNGPLQRDNSTRVSGGQLIIGIPGGLTSNPTTTDFLSPAVAFANQPVPTVVADDAALPPLTLHLPVDYLVNGGFTNTAIYGNLSVTLPTGTPLSLTPGSTFSVRAPRINVFSGITDLGGTVQFRTVETVDAQQASLGRTGVQLGDGVALDVRGQWTNDSQFLGSPFAPQPTLQDGGTIELALTIPGGELILGNDVALHASGGAWLNSSGRLAAGHGGSIAVQAAPAGSALQVGGGVTLDAFGVATAGGGTLNLSAPRLQIAQNSTQWTRAQRLDDSSSAGGTFEVFTPLFSHLGFSSVNLSASGLLTSPSSPADAMTVDAGAEIAALTRTLQLTPGYSSRPSGGTVGEFTQAVTLPQINRPPESISLAVVPQGEPSGFVVTSGVNDVGLLDVQKGASISVDPGARISLAGVGGVSVDGTLRAPSGTITLETLTTGDPNLDPGFVADLALRVGGEAVLDVSGTSVLKPNDAGLLLGSVLPGGSVNLFADRGSVLTQAGSLISIAGTSAPLDIQTGIGSGQYSRHQVASGAGTLTVRAPESIALLGDLEARAGSGDLGRPDAGTLEVDLTRSQSWFSAGEQVIGTFPATPREIEIAPNIVASQPVNGLAALDPGRLLQSGIDALRLQAGDGLSIDSSSIQLATNLPVNLVRQISLDAPVISVANGMRGSLTAAYVSLGNSQGLAGPASPSAGSGTLTVSGQHIDLIGPFSIDGTSAVTLSSGGDLLLRGANSANARFVGSLATGGDLTLDAARIYPATGTAFTMSSNAAGGTIAVGRTAASPGSPLSAAGSLTLAADNIVSTGTLLAPFGSIDLEAGRSLTLGDASITSVSGAGAVLPYGSTQLAGAQWIYTSQVPQLPQRQVTLHGAQVSIATNASVDLRGGGDLYAYEWVPGTGGTRDALATGVIPGLYAILPSSAAQYATYDPLLWAGSSLSPGASVYLSGAAGVPAGVYALLPARYGLLPGARLIQMESGFQDIALGQLGALPDGTPIVAGYLTLGNTGLRDAQYSGFAIFPSSYARALAGYQDTLASTFFAAASPASPVPADAGRLSLDIGSNLALGGQVLSAAMTGGRAAEIDISATSLAITGAGGTGPSGAVDLPASVIQEWGAGELVLGGRPSQDNSGISVTATTLTVGSGVQLSADQLLLAANQSIDVQPGAMLTTTSTRSGAAVNTPGSVSVTLSGAGSVPAMLALSDQSLLIAQRPSVSGGSAGGSVTLESGSLIGTRGALSVDAPGGATLAGSMQVPGGTVSLASSSIGLLAGSPSSDALVVSSGAFSVLQTAQNVRLASQGPIDVYAPLTLGLTNGATTPSLASLRLIGSALNNHGGGDVGFGAGLITLQGVNAPAAAPSSGAGTLSLVAGEVDIGPGAFALNGFAKAAVLAHGAMVGQGSGGVVSAGDMSIEATELTAAAGSQTSLSATGTLQIATAGSAVPVPADLGGALTLTASRIEDNGTIRVAGGVVSLQSSGDLTLSANALIDAAGATVQVLDRSVAAAAGSVNLSAGGSLTLAAGSRIDVSGSGSGSAGRIALGSGGAADLQSTLLGHASAGATGGTLLVNVGQLNTDLNTLGASAQSGGFSDQIALRVHSGDLALSAGSTLSANRVELTTDSGVVRVAGSIIAPSDAQRGHIDLFGGTGVVLTSGGQLRADGSARDSRAGDIELGSGSSGTVELDAGSTVSARGNGGNGTLLVRAPATAGGDIGVAALNADLAGVGQVVLEPVLRTPISSAPALADFGAIETAVSNYAASAATVIPARLNSGGALPLVIRPGVELDASSNVALNDALDLTTWRFGGQPIDLTVRSTGSITVNSTISDGFVSGTTDLLKPTTVLTDGPSSSVRLIAGADLQSPNPLAVASGAQADLTVAPGAVVRTGTGELDLVAPRDVVISSGASAYTAGLAAVPAQTVARTNSVFNFPAQGGDLVVSAGRDVLGTDVSQSVAAWQLREGNTRRAVPVQWGVDLSQFGWNLATLGGGDLTVVAARDINDVSAAASDSRIANTDGTSTMLFGGGLRVAAGADVGSGQFYAADGTARLSAGGAFSAIRPISVGPTTRYIGSLIALNDAQVSVQARLDINIDAVVNPTTLAPPPPPQPARATLASAYFTYGGDSSVTLQSTAGSATIVNNGGNLSALMGQDAASGFGGQFGQAYPATFIARSLQRDISFSGGGATLFPSDNGQLELLAARDIKDNGATIVMSDAFANTLPTPDAPGPGGALPPSLLVAFASGRHASDPLPALITAGRDITALTISIPKPARFTAGQDISDLAFYGQNLNSSDRTLISAGRDFVDSLGDAGAVVQLGGPGRLDVLAGRNVDLGFSEGITTVGNLANANLMTAAGADLTIMAGLGGAPDYLGFLKKIIEPSSMYQQQLLQYVEAQTGQQLTVGQADSDFATLSSDQQRALVDAVFFDELLASGRESNTVRGAGFQRGYAAIDALFPGSRTATLAPGVTDPFKGDLTLTFSRTYTVRGGAISLFTPGGAVDVGLANPPAGVPQRLPSQLGIVAQGAGDVDIYSKGDVLVNQSRIFTLGGGNILIWSNEGSIDAGRGSKSSISAPPPQVVFDALGNVTLDLAGAVAGSGIRTIQIDPSVPPGNVDLIAPQGTVNAGDAGIGAAGNLNIAAQQVIGLDNIQFGGTATGVPAQVSNVGVALSGAAATSGSATNSATESASAEKAAKQTTPLAQMALSWLEVFVTGLGEENCKTDDLECLKRQKSATK